MKIEAFFSLILGDTVLLSSFLGFLLFCLIGIWAYFRAIRPKKGTLEWMRRFDKRTFQAFVISPFHWIDLLWFFLSILFSAGLHFLRLFNFFELYRYPLPHTEILKQIIHGFGPILILSAVLFLLYRLIFSSGWVCMLLSLLGTMVCSREIWLTILVVCSLGFLYIWLCSCARPGMGFSFIWLLFSGIFFGLALLSRWAILYLTPVYVGAYILGKVYQWNAVETERRGMMLFISFALLFSYLIFGGLLLWLVYYIYNHDHVAFWQALTSAETYRSLFPTVWEKLGDITIHQKLHVTIFIRDAFLFLLGIGCSIPAVHGAFKLRQSVALTALLCLIPFLLLWLIGGIYLMLPALLLPIGWVFSVYAQRGYSRYSFILSLAAMLFIFAQQLL